MHVNGGAARLFSALEGGGKITVRNWATNDLADVRIFDGALVVMNGRASMQAEKMAVELLRMIGRRSGSEGTKKSPAQGDNGE